MTNFNQVWREREGQAKSVLKASNASFAVGRSQKIQTFFFYIPHFSSILKMFIVRGIHRKKYNKILILHGEKCFVMLCPVLKTAPLVFVGKGLIINPGKSRFKLQFPGKSRDPGNGIYLINSSVLSRNKQMTLPCLCPSFKSPFSKWSCSV